MPGREYAQTEALRVNWANVLELMLNDGRCTITGERLPLAQPRRLDEIETFADFLTWYRAELAHFLDLGMRGLNLLDAAWPSLLPAPFESLLMAGCLESGRDVTAGGTQYNLSSVNALGMADVADSLVAIDRLVFRERCVTLPDLAQAVRSDFAGESPWRHGHRPGRIMAMMSMSRTRSSPCWPRTSATRWTAGKRG